MIEKKSSNIFSQIKLSMEDFLVCLEGRHRISIGKESPLNLRGIAVKLQGIVIEFQGIAVKTNAIHTQAIFDKKSQQKEFPVADYGALIRISVLS